MRAYSLDLRHKVVNAVLRGMPKAQAAHAFGIGISTVRRYVDTAQKGEDLAPRRPSGKKRKLDELRMRLMAQDLKEHPTATLSRRREYLARVAGVRVSESTISRAIKRLGWSRKKRSVGAAERNEFLRAAWRAMVVGRTQAGRLVFVDECSTNTSLSPLYAYSPKGQRARCKVPRNYGPNVTLLTSMSAGGMGPCLAVQGATTRVVFEAYVEEVLGPSLRPGQIVVMDNLSSHKGDLVRGLIDERGCELLYLPPYSSQRYS